MFIDFTSVAYMVIGASIWGFWVKLVIVTCALLHTADCGSVDKLLTPEIIRRLSPYLLLVEKLVLLVVIP